MRCCIVGGGIIGLATGRLLTVAESSTEVIVLEKERRVAAHQSSHNSGVVHAGLYYEPGSLKAKLCVRGRELLHAYCAERGIAYQECGKVLIATDEREHARLQHVYRRALANGVKGVQMLTESGLHELEPHARGIAALHSPKTAIVSYEDVARSLAAETARGGGQVRCGAEVMRVSGGRRPAVQLADGQTIAADFVIVCAGLHSDRLAARSGQQPTPKILPFRGEYWALRRERSHLVKGLVYPVPDPRLPFLGVHFTKRLDGSVLVGPNAVLALAREGYQRGASEVAQLQELALYTGAWRLLARHWRSAAIELARAASPRLLTSEARRMLPELRLSDLIPAGTGVRAQAVDADGTLVEDFRLSTDGSVVWVRNAPSPAATSSLAIAEVLVERLRTLSPASPGAG